MDGYSLLLHIFKLMDSHEELKVKHEYRETNQCVNALARVGLAIIGSLNFSDFVPDCIKRFIEMDENGTSFPRVILA